MTYTTIFRGTVQKGRLRLDERDRFQHHLTSFEGKRIEITLQRERTKRSLDQNAYMWGVVYRELAEWSGYTVNEVHDYMRAMFLPMREIALPGGKVVSALGSTAELSTAAHSEYIERIKAWASQQGVPIPEPNEVAVA